MTINNNIPLKAYLRADSHSQVFVVNNNTEVKNLVSLEMFWGNMGHEGIYLDYSLIKNRSINVTEGISKNNLTQTLYGEDCDDWINENFINNKNINKLFVIQGYAGCGKTTFINNLIHNSGQDMYSYYINVGNNWSYQQEPYLFFNESLLKFIECMNNIISKTKTRNRIWNKFIEIGSDPDIKELDLELPNIISEFKKIKKNSRWKVLGNNIHQFLYDNYSNKTNKINIWYNVGQVQTIVALLILLICSQFCVEENTNPKYYMLIFDDLDIITNPAIPAENVLSLWGVIHR